MIRNRKFLLFLLMIIPWLTIPLLGKKSFIRFLPASIFITTVVKLEDMLAEKRRWWWFYEKIHPKIGGNTPFIVGPFFIGSMWILKFTYGKFYIYLLINTILDSLFTYVLTNSLQRLGIASLVRLTRVQLSGLFFIKSLLLYGFQYMQERQRKEDYF
ncbi:hypothetical protein [Bacillus weihaiensis]|uniref:Uncharacterized protein n=1 Tax=Bacillus weihaiensis TaxID=1547283 RepID=A0A1L3MTS2_9BACI|nr:hypothetical protein [Bacillus weihaiensis]APH05704.1 hypothetical protein A9C19_13630 [Bacillus weihaiensis]